MRSVWILMCLLAVAAIATGAIAAPSPRPGLVPWPRLVEPRAGQLTVTDRTTIFADQPAAREAAGLFADLLGRTTGVSLATTASAPAAIRFRTVAGLPAEGYRLEVDADGAEISASDAAGLFYGGVTLWQLLTERPAADGRLVAPAVRIEDAPRFGWRGLMLDSARHFQSPDFIRRLIDAMAVHKLNRLHWHLVDDQAWRIEIRRYPRLTETGAWRAPASAPGAPALPPVGGSYRQDEIRGIVAYARARGIEIVPEIEMPGHALAPIRAYPGLGTGVAPPPGIESDWGVFPYLYNVEDGTFAFLENVLDEVLELFPGTYIHVGGDEAVKDQWRASPQVQARMRALGIADEAALQTWFVNRIGRFLEARGRRLVGWNEILEGGLPAGATIMSWQGIDGAVHAAQAGHDAVLAAAPILYLDNRQAADAAEPPGRGRTVTLADVYAFDPSPDRLTEAEQGHILGLQANLWTEHVRTEARAAHMAFPRAAAVAELGWSPPGSRDYRDFAARLAPQLDRLAALGIAAAPSAYRPVATARFDPATDRINVALSNEAQTEIRYTLDGSAPTIRSPVFSAPLELGLPARLRAVGVLGDRLLPGAIDQSFDAASVRRRDDNGLRLCSENIALSLEDDWPAEGPRAVFLLDIMNPCWIWEHAPMDGVAAIAVDVGQLPFNFQIGRDIERIRFRPPASAAGELEVRAGGCDGELVATLPLAPATASPGVTRLNAPIAPRTGAADLCFTYTASGPEPLWAIDAVQLVAPE